MKTNNASACSSSRESVSGRPQADTLHAAVAVHAHHFHSGANAQVRHLRQLLHQVMRHRFRHTIPPHDDVNFAGEAREINRGLARRIPTAHDEDAPTSTGVRLRHCSAVINADSCTRRHTLGWMFAIRHSGRSYHAARQHLLPVVETQALVSAFHGNPGNLRGS